MDESIVCRDRVIRIVAAMTTARAVVDYTCRLPADQARSDSTRLTAKIRRMFRNGAISKRIGWR
jgi:hypothetical protein|tara:strand:+ start:3436 stop:3627 length:192 start_codon:yes stop_codon:yes gene_type:complete